MKHQGEIVKLFVRLPAEMRDFLKAEAQRNLSNENSEVVRSIRMQMDRAGWKGEQRRPVAEER